MSTIRGILTILVIQIFLAAANITLAAEWPTERPIRLIVPTPPGGGVDILARTLAERLGNVLNQTVIVENRTGANGVLANNELAKSPPDGYTALFTYTSALAVNMALQAKLPYDTLRDLKPVAQVSAAPTFLAVTTDVPVNDLESFFKWVKDNPRNQSYGSWGNGSLGHLTMEALKKQTGINISHVPYRGSAPVLSDMVSGVLKVAFVDTVASLPYIKQGKIRALAINGNTRAPLSPDVPTLSEQGYPVNLESWFGIFVQGKTPDNIVLRLNSEINRVLVTPEMKARFMQLNMSESHPKRTDEFARTVQEDVKVWGEVIRANNIKLD